MFITIGYSVLQSVFSIHGYARIDVGDGMVFTNIDVTENTNGSIESAPTIKLKTMINTKVSFNGEGSVTFTVAAQNQGEYDAKLLRVQKLDNTNEQEPQCIQTSITNHDVGETVYKDVVKTFEVTVTSTCTEYSSKEIEIYFKYKAQESQGGGEIPEVPGNGNAVQFLLNNKVEDSVVNGNSGFVALDNEGKVTTSTTPREYRYIGPNPDNYVSINGDLWRIIGIFDGQLKVISAYDNFHSWDSTWDSNGTNDWSTSSLQQYLNSEFLTSILTFNPDDPASPYQVISDHTWNLGASRTDKDVTAQMFYERERGTEVYEGNSTEWTGKIGLMYASDYGFATSGGDITTRNSCLAKELYNWNSVSECYNNNWLYYFSSPESYEVPVQGTLTPSFLDEYDSSGVFQLEYETGSLSQNDTSAIYSIRPTFYLKPVVIFTGGSGTEEDPYILDMPPLVSDYLYNNLQDDVPAGESGLVGIDTSTGEILMDAYDVRYIGPNPNNYVKFNNELWRIIGNVGFYGGDVDVKITRAKPLDTKMAWDSDLIQTRAPEPIVGSNDWSTSSLQTYLNGEYLNSIDSTSQSYIADYITWPLGGSSTVVDVTAPMFYERERGTEVYTGRPTEWNGKIALIYPSDYGFATSGGPTTGRNLCLKMNLYAWNKGIFGDCKNNSWLYDSANYHWTLTPRGDMEHYVFYVGMDGDVFNLNVDDDFSVRPTLFLDYRVRIASGSGTETDPFILCK